ncbi:signal peptidase I [Pseudoxanthomonas kalamensis DSM 18571]|uniref:signal peptidase I n=1 Tax=Pseudoxanthomonas kalamensis TaxID=289483 RepID=UPI0013913D45|nr:signal peptidase I [Pseudoxanthomonas kalamensis]KAF1712476.1 signal peptidase I [Pseudoxanthomonas kalamensis DSM 18571]
MHETTAMPRHRRRLAWLRRELLPIAVMLLLLGAARSSFANHYIVPSGSMQDTLMPGDRVVVNMSAYGVRLPFTGVELLDRAHPRAGDVAVFDSPADGTRLIKRIVAAGGDRIEVRDGHVRLNGRELRLGPHDDVERFGGHLARINLDAGGGPDVPALTVPEGMLLVMGDHRGNSFDGRYFGLVRADDVYGKAVAVYFRRGEGFVWQRL